jgi:hypothetical protein
MRANRIYYPCAIPSTCIYIIYLVESSKWWFHILYWTLVCGDDMPRYLMLGDGITGYFEFFFVFNEIV